MEIDDFKVKDRESFIVFLEFLREDFLNNKERWENKTLDDFLEAMSAWIEDMQGYYDNTNQKIHADVASWQTFADIFKAARIYE